MMKTLYTAESISRGGRSGTIKTPDGKPIVTLGNPLEPGAEKRGPGPELLFAGAYSACFHSAVLSAAKRLGTAVETDTIVRAIVSLIEDSDGGYGLNVKLHVRLPGVARTKAQQIVDEAHKSCPYSKALRGETPVTLVVD